MKLTAENLSELADTALKAASAAAYIIHAHAKKSVSVRKKQAGQSLASQVVTEVDLLCEQAIIETLAPLSDQYDLALLSEESVDDRARFSKDYFWCIDPMDGTLSFIEGVPGYAVSIALVKKDGTPVIGVVLDPVTQTSYCAIDGQGVWRNGTLWVPPVSSIPAQSLTFVCDRGFTQRAYYRPVCKALESIAIDCGYSAVDVLEKNGAVLNACYVLENPASVYFKCPKTEQGGGSLWDFAATAAIFLELGFIASDFYGAALDLNRADSTYMNHRGVLFAVDRKLAEEIQGLITLCQ